jgi:hypothetical protein
MYSLLVVISIVGANAVVVKDVPPFKTVVGVPAKSMRSSAPAETASASSEKPHLAAVPEVLSTDASSLNIAESAGTMSSLSSAEKQAIQIAPANAKSFRCSGAFIPYGTPCGSLPDPIAREMCQMLQEMGQLQSRILALEQQLSQNQQAPALRKLSSDSAGSGSSVSNPNGGGGGKQKHLRKRSNSPENCFMKRHASWLDLKKFA